MQHPIVLRVCVRVFVVVVCLCVCFFNPVPSKNRNSSGVRLCVLDQHHIITTDSSTPPSMLPQYRQVRGMRDVLQSTAVCHRVVWNSSSSSSSSGFVLMHRHTAGVENDICAAQRRVDTSSDDPAFNESAGEYCACSSLDKSVLKINHFIAPQEWRFCLAWPTFLELRAVRRKLKDTHDGWHAQWCAGELW